jgi:hypothetical protein
VRKKSKTNDLSFSQLKPRNALSLATKEIKKNSIWQKACRESIQSPLGSEIHKVINKLQALEDSHSPTNHIYSSKKNRSKDGGNLLYSVHDEVKY